MKHLALIIILCAACKKGDEKKAAPEPSAKPEPAAGSGSAAPAPTPAPNPTTQPSTDKPGEKVDTLALDKTCKLDTDCQVVDELPCNPCNCGAVAVAKAAVQTFDAASKAIKCEARPADEKCGECKPNKAVCESGRCAAAAQ